MGIKNHVGSGHKPIGRDSLRKAGDASSSFQNCCWRRVWHNHQKLVLRTKRFLLMMTAVFAQHLNLFDFHFEDYNVKLIAYIFLILSVKISKLTSTAVESQKPLQTPGLRDFLRYYRVFAIFGVFYLFCTMYENLTPLKLLFLVY